MYNFPKRTEVECLTLKALKDEKMKELRPREIYPLSQASSL